MADFRNDRYSLNRVDIVDDFLGGVVDGTNLFTTGGTWGLSASSGSPSVSSRQSLAHAPGVARITTGGSSGNDAFLVFGGVLEECCMATDVHSLDVRFRVSHATSLDFSVGIFEGSVPGSGEAAFACFAGGKVGAVIRGDDDTATMQSDIDVTANAWIRMRIELLQDTDPNAARLKFFDTDGDLLWQSRPVVPGGFTQTPLYLAAWVKTTTSEARWLELDRVALGLRVNRFKPGQ